MRIGLFGGTFNPVHLAHLRVAQEILENFKLDGIRLIPSALPPHKEVRGLADARARLEMLRLAVAGNPGFIVSDVEVKRSGPSYTVDTLDFFRESMPGGTEMFLMIGLDAFFEIDTWKAYERLFAETSIIVMTRGMGGHGGKPPREDNLPEEMLGFLRANVSPAYTFNPIGSCFEAKGRSVVHLGRVTRMDISSTNIRRLVREGRSIRYLVSGPVADYIHDKGLYHDPSD